MMKRNEKLIRTKLWQYLLPGIMMTAALQMGNIVDTWRGRCNVRREDRDDH